MEKNYQKILVAIDGSEQSEKAFEKALEIAKRNHAKLFITYVLDDTGYFHEAYVSSDKYKTGRKQAEMGLLNKQRQADAADIPAVESFVKIGRPKRVIATILPEQYKIDLIVMGATGKGAIERVLVGSTTAYVVNHAPCNVLVVR